MTDTDALKERIAEELYYSDHPEGRHRSEWPGSVYPETVYEYRDLAAAVLPIVAEEVRAASEKAWDACAEYASNKQILPRPDAAFLARKNPHRTTEAGDSDEHR